MSRRVERPASKRRRTSRAWIPAASIEVARPELARRPSICSSCRTTAWPRTLRFSGDGDARRAPVAPGDCCRCRRRRLPDMVRHDPLGLFDLLREQLGGAQAGINLGVTEGGYVSSDLRSRLLDREARAAAVRRRFFPRADDSPRRACAARRVMQAPATRTREPATRNDRHCEVQFAGGHRIAVETESVIRRESILNTAGSLALILPLLFLVFRSPWLVARRFDSLRRCRW